MKQSLRQLLKEHYAQQSLSQKQLKLLESMEDSHKGAGSKKRRFTKIFWLAAAAMFAVIFLWSVNPLFYRGKVYQIADEIAYNHRKMLTPEIRNSSFGEVRDHLAKLDFTMVQVENFKTGEWELIGGRYCSIDKKLAAQLRIKNLTDKQLYTWYQVAWATDDASLPEGFQHYSKGIKVQLWVEKGVLHGLAVESPL